VSLRDYLEAFHRAVERIDEYGFAESIDIQEEIRPAKQAVIKAYVTLVDGSILNIMEYIDAKYRVEKISFAYQYQNREGKLIFRYDNASHRPALKFTDHKHLPDGSIVQSSISDIADVVDEVIGYL
jgi:predicted AlkP superfamily phosphohydrolase/phosphomutase